jgi:hypothetical protein
MALSSIYAQKIFMLLKSWSGVGEFKISIPELHDLLDAPESLRANFKNFRIFALEPSVKQINEKTSVKYTWEAIKSGRKVTEIRFTFIKPVAAPKAAPAISAPKTAAVERYDVPIQAMNDESEYPPEFEAFWTVYPRPDGKKSAYRLWLSVTKTDTERRQLIEAVKNYTRYHKDAKTELKYIKTPKAFFFEGYWQEWICGSPVANSVVGEVSETERAAIIAKYTDEDEQRDDRAIKRELDALKRERAG